MDPDRTSICPLEESKHPGLTPSRRVVHSTAQMRMGGVQARLHGSDSSPLPPRDFGEALTFEPVRQHERPVGLIEHEDLLDEHAQKLPPLDQLVGSGIRLGPCRDGFALRASRLRPADRARRAPNRSGQPGSQIPPVTRRRTQRVGPHFLRYVIGCPCVPDETAGELSNPSGMGQEFLDRDRRRLHQAAECRRRSNRARKPENRAIKCPRSPALRKSDLSEERERLKSVGYELELR